jgi:dipeptidyl aminopeptidase/acylaminoacyl peptidase
MPPRSALLALLLFPAALPAQQSPASHTPSPAVQARVSSILDGIGQAKHPGTLALSPDGHTLAMVLPTGLAIQRLSDTGTAEGQPSTVAVCPHGAAVSSLTWSPDSAHLAILATCDNTPGVYLVDHGATSAHRLAELHGFAEALQYTPDGHHLAMLYVEGATRPSGALAPMKPPAGVIGVEGLEIQRVAQIDATSGAVTELTPTDLHVYEFSFSADSQKLAFVAAPPPGENNWWVAKLYTQPAQANTQPTAILDPSTVEGPLHGLQIAVPRWSPDGTQIAFIGGLMSDQGATGGDLYTIAATGGAPFNTTPGTHVSFMWLSWLPSGTAIATAFDAGEEEVDTVQFPALSAADHKAVHHEIQTLPYSAADGRLEGSFALSADGKTAAWTASSFTQAPEVFAGPLTRAPLPQLTHLNDGLAPTWGKAESLRWTNDNFKLQGWLLYPAHYDPAKKYGLIVMVHGGPSSAVLPRWPYAGFGAAPFSAMDYFVFQPNPRGSFGEGETFTQANRKDFGYGDLRDILAGVDAAEKHIPAIDNNRLGLTGWSYGGFMTMFGVTQTQRFKAAVAGAGISDWLSYYGENSIDQWMTPFFGATVYDDPAVYAKSSAIDFIKQAKTPTLVVVGDRDGECPAPQSFEFWHALRAQGVPTELVVYPDEGHGFRDPAHRRDVIARALGWFAEYLQ